MNDWCTFLKYYLDENVQCTVTNDHYNNNIIIMTVKLLGKLIGHRLSGTHTQIL